MKTYEVVLTKSYIVKIKAEDEFKAKEYSEYFTNNIQKFQQLKMKKSINLK